MVWASLQILWVIPPWKRLSEKAQKSCYNTPKFSQPRLAMAAPMHQDSAYEMFEHIQRKKEEGKKAAEKQCTHDACPEKCSSATARTFSKWKVRTAGEKTPNPLHLWPADFNPFTVSVLAVSVFCQTQWQFSCGLWYHLKFFPDLLLKGADFYFLDLSLSPRNLAVSWQRPGQTHFLSLALAGFKLAKQESCFWPTYCAPQHHSGPMTPLFSIISLVVIAFGVAYFLWKVGGKSSKFVPRKSSLPLRTFCYCCCLLEVGGRGHITLLFCGEWRGAHYHHLASHKVTGSWQPTPPSPPSKNTSRSKLAVFIHAVLLQPTKSQRVQAESNIFPAYERYTNNCKKNNTHTQMKN